MWACVVIKKFDRSLTNFKSKTVFCHSNENRKGWRYIMSVKRKSYRAQSELEPKSTELVATPFSIQVHAETITLIPRRGRQRGRTAKQFGLGTRS